MGYHPQWAVRIVRMQCSDCLFVCLSKIDYCVFFMFHFLWSQTNSIFIWECHIHLYKRYVLTTIAINLLKIQFKVRDMHGIRSSYNYLFPLCVLLLFFNYYKLGIFHCSNSVATIMTSSKIKSSQRHMLYKSEAWPHSFHSVFKICESNTSRRIILHFRRKFT